MLRRRGLKQLTEGRLNSRFQTAFIFGVKMKEEVLAYIRANPGCTSSGVNRAVRNDKSWADWIHTREDIDGLVREGKVEMREFRGIDVFYAVE